MLRRVDHGDHDLIITFMTRDQGKISVIAKNAKKSVKRFSGVLELFSVLQIVSKQGRGKLPHLQEATLTLPFYRIREDIKKTAYASYFAEVINAWVEEKSPQRETYELLRHVLEALDRGDPSEEELSILFQMRFLSQAGLSPNLTECSLCQTRLDDQPGMNVMLSLEKGGFLCHKCRSHVASGRQLSKGTIKQLLWLGKETIEQAGRIRFSHRAVQEGLHFLEAFVTFQLGKDLRSLKFLRRIRK
jgi:DNA repair protein RecO (recombination protein O)